MAHFFKLQNSLDEAAKVYFAMKQAASDHSAREKQAIIKVQSVYRGSKVRDRWHAVLHNALLVQRLSRGWLARVRTRALRLERTKALNTIFFHHCASVIQKFFRGWWSRRYLHDYYGRKGYLGKVAKRGDWTKEYLRRHHAQKVAEAKAEEESQMRQEFDNLAGELHHLVSTKSIAGVYNPPYNDILPKAFEKPIEQHLRDSCRVRLPKSLKRPRHRSLPHGAYPNMATSGAYLPTPDYPATGPPQDLPDRAPHGSRTASVGRMQKIQGPFRNREQIEVANAKASTTFRSIQSQAAYDVVEKEKKMQTRLDKLTRVSPVDFMAPGLPAATLPPSSVHASAPYRDRPSELRSDYVELPKIRDKPPFFTALPRDKHFHDYEEQNLLPCGHV
mmetsp:Transcript_129784/g.225554  ORF Transcript_129784/g.225554 Transcript_129784/m.225554 type:complete len:389 (-) Transcript_129784:86-1252(-)